MQANAHGRKWCAPRLAALGLLLALGACALDEDAASSGAVGDETVAEESSAITALVTYNVTVIKTGSGGGSVFSTPAAIDCSPACSVDVAAGTVLTLTAVPHVSSSFGGWSGGGCSGTGTCTITVNSDITVGANFPQNFYPLTVSKSGFGSGTVTSSNGAINCGTSCSTSAPYNYSFTLTATPAAGSLFLGWSGACSGTGSCYVTMTQARAVTAVFVQANPTVSVMKTGSGAGAVFSSPSYITCSPTCNAPVPYGTVLTLTAAPHISSIFGGWNGGGCSGTGTCTLTVTQDVTVGANFQQKFFTLSVGKSGNGTVTSSPGGINCGASCSTSAPYNYSFNLTATPAGGSVFLGWGGACSGTGSCYVTMTQARYVTATFSP